MIDVYEQILKDEKLKEILDALQSCKVCIVGGYIRDLFMGKISHDKDIIVTDIKAQDAAKLLADKLDAHFIELDPVNNIYRVVLQDKITYVDIVNPIENDLNQDLLRRDFTINAICFDINNKKIIDPCGGMEDLSKKIINFIDEKNFEDDPLRVLRAFRFYSTLGFDFSPNLINIFSKYSSLIDRCAVERINAEITKLFEGRNAHNSLLELDKTGLIEKFFPIMKDVKTIPTNTHHHLPLFYHCIETVKQAEERFSMLPEVAQKHLLNNDLGEFSRKAYLKLACFLHDIGKPTTWTIEDETGRHRFIKHDEIGAELIPSTLKPLKYSNKQIAYVQNLVRNHIYPASLVSYENALPKAKMRFFRKLENNVIDVILLAQADRLSARGIDITDEMVETNINNLNELLKLYIETKESIKPLPKLLSGEEIMKLLNISPSPILGKIIKDLQEEQISGNITTKEEAVEFVLNSVTNKHK